MTLDEFKKLKTGDKLMTLGVISSKSEKFWESFIVPAGSIAVVKTGEIIYAKEVDDFYCECDVEYKIRNKLKRFPFFTTEKKIGQIAVNPSDCELAK